MNKPQRKNEWLVSFLDMWMLLLAFFLILAARSDQDPFFFSRNTSTGLMSVSPGQEPVITPIWELLEDLKGELEPEIRSNQLRIQTFPDELRLQFIDAQFFETASSDISESGMRMIRRLTGVINHLEDYDFHIDVEGHTDDRPIQTVRFRNNWELSAARAATIVGSLSDAGFPPPRMKASGFADTQPLMPNQDEWNRPNPDHMALNRRIVVRIHYPLDEWP